MPTRSSQQKIGALGHQMLKLEIERNPVWLARDLGEDYGIDMEAELTENQVRGEILKIQVKSHAGVEHSDGAVKFVVDRRYVEYASVCRYPVVMVVMDTKTEEGWYLWLQDWLMRKRAKEGSSFTTDQSSWTEWVPEKSTITSGFDGELKDIARWRGDMQRALSLRDAIRATASLGEEGTTRTLVRILLETTPTVADVTLDAVISELVMLADRVWNTVEGNILKTQLFALVRELGDRISKETISNMVIRGDTYSRTGLIALGLLYDDFFDHTQCLGLPEYFVTVEPRVAYYCAYRESRPDEKSYAPMDPTGFEFAGLRYERSDRALDKWANRGASALLDDLSFA